MTCPLNSLIAVGEQPEVRSEVEDSGVRRFLLDAWARPASKTICRQDNGALCRVTSAAALSCQASESSPFTSLLTLPHAQIARSAKHSKVISTCFSCSCRSYIPATPQEYTLPRSRAFAVLARIQWALLHTWPPLSQAIQGKQEISLCSAAPIDPECRLLLRHPGSSTDG